MNNTINQLQADTFLFFIGVVILHEYVHCGDYANGNLYSYQGGSFDEGNPEIGLDPL